MQKSEGFSSRIGFILAAAGSAVGLGNIWRFPYLAAQHGGGIFLLTYLILMLTFGYALLLSENAIGRMTGKGPIGSFRGLTADKGKGLRWIGAGGYLNALAPCSTGVSVVNIDNGFGAGYLANRINRMKGIDEA